MPKLREKVGSMSENIPKYAIFRGRKVRILYYDNSKSSPFRILDRYDDQRDVRRNQLVFLPEKK